jgi:hypothetical protein
VVGTVTTQSSGTVASGDVISESPSAGTSVNPGSAVNLVVSTGPAPGGPPLVLSLSSYSVTAPGSQFTLTVTGENFSSNAEVLWNGEARAVTSRSGTQLQATILTGDLNTAGTYLVTVANGSPEPAISAAEPFTVLPASPGPPVAEITGAALEPHSGGYTLTLTGMNFVSGAAVKWNGSSLSSPTYVSPTELVVTVPSSDTLPASITVTNPSEAASAPFKLP